MSGVGRRPKCLRSGDTGSKPPGVPRRGRVIFCAALGSYVSGLITNVTSKCSKMIVRQNERYDCHRRKQDHDTCVKQGAVREALEDTCQEHCGGAKNCIRYGTNRTKYRTVPSLQIPTSRTVPDAEKPQD